MKENKKLRNRSQSGRKTKRYYTIDHLQIGKQG
jgi:hypothetical protein